MLARNNKKKEQKANKVKMERPEKMPHPPRGWRASAAPSIPSHVATQKVSNHERTEDSTPFMTRSSGRTWKNCHSARSGKARRRTASNSLPRLHRCIRKTGTMHLFGTGADEVTATRFLLHAPAIRLSSVQQITERTTQAGWMHLLALTLGASFH